MPENLKNRERIKSAIKKIGRYALIDRNGSVTLFVVEEQGNIKVAGYNSPCMSERRRRSRYVGHA
jgi:hypothetical protein